MYFEVFLFLAVVYCQLDYTLCGDQLNNITSPEHCEQIFSCHCKNKTCFDEELICNGRSDCEDADDENGCIKLELKSTFQYHFCCAKIATSEKTSGRCYCREEVSESGGKHSLNCVDTELASFPTLIQDFSLVKIYFTGNKLTKLSMGTFSESFPLKDILLPHNEINTIENNTFAELGNFHKIRNLDLSDNHITKLEPAMFRSLPPTSFLSLARNQILDIENDTFAELTINNIDLSHNNLTKLEAYIFENNKKLKQLSLFGNEISHIEPSTFDGLINLQILNLSSNPLHDVDKNLFNHNTELNNLFVDDLNVCCHTKRTYCNANYDSSYFCANHTIAYTIGGIFLLVIIIVVIFFLKKYSARHKCLAEYFFKKKITTITITSKNMPPIV